MLRHALMVALLAGAGCKKDSTITAADPRDAAERDLLWAMAPGSVTRGFVATPSGWAQLDAAWTRIAPVMPLDAELRAQLLGGATTPAAADWDPRRGLAMFVAANDQVLMITPARDAAAVQAALFTQNESSGRAWTCRSVQGRTTCADDPALFAQVGLAGNSITEAFAKALPSRGNVELHATTSRDTLRLSAQVDPGQAAVRFRFDSTLAPSAVALVSSKPAPPPSRASGWFRWFAGPDLGAVFANAPGLNPQAAQALATLAGDFELTAPAGHDALALRVGLKAESLWQMLLSSCDSLGFGATVNADNSCSLASIPALGLPATGWLDGKQLMIASARPVPAGTGDVGTAISAELAGYPAAIWGRGSLHDLATLQAQAGMFSNVVSLMAVLNEFGLGVRATADHVEGLLFVRTTFANPAPLVAELDPWAFVVDADRASKVRALAAKHPKSPLAADLAAGPAGLKPVVLGVGIMASVAIPAFFEYMQKGKQSEAQLQLNRISKSAKAYYIENGAYPVGEAGPSPLGNPCLEKTGIPEDWNEAPWQALELGLEGESLRFQYSYQSDGQSFMARATADLDCDGSPAEWTATGTVFDGQPGVTIQQTGFD